MPQAVNFVGFWTVVVTMAASIALMGTVIALRVLPLFVRQGLRLRLAGHRGLVDAEPRPEFDHLPTALAVVAVDTSLLRGELERIAATARPEVPRKIWAPLRPWLARGQTDDFDQEIEATRRVWEWIEQVEALPSPERSRLSELGLDLDPIRRTLTDAQGAPAIDRISSLLRRFERELSAHGGDPYRTGHQNLPACLRNAATAASGTRAQREALFIALTTELHGHLFRLARSYAGTEGATEDLLQDMATALWRALPRYRGDAPVRAFALRVAYNRAISHLRRKSRTVSPAREDVERSSDPTLSLEERLERTRQCEALQRALERLGPGLREVMLMHLEGLSYADIAQVVGITEKNVSARLSRGRAALRSALAEVTP